MVLTCGSIGRRGVLMAALGALCLALVTSSASSAQGRTAATAPARALMTTLMAEGPHPSLSQDAHLFDRFVGAWTCEYSFHADDGSVRHATGEVTFGWIIDGWAIQDTWISYPADATKKERNIGTSIRFFDTKSRTWRIVFVSPAAAALTTVQGGMEGDRIVLRGQDSDGSLLRWSFNDMRPDSFVWRGEKSRDAGRTWRLEEEHRMRRRALPATGELGRQP